MKINRHNYEAYFILYLDNELNADDRRMVEAFTGQHPDLKEELDLLLQFKLAPDTEIFFPGKEDLMKVKGETPVTMTNYEEWLVLYIDNELNARQRKEVESFLAKYPSIQKELALLQKTKLHPAQVVFPGKESLYRKEERVSVLPVRWWRIAAAAVLLLGIGITTAVIVNNKPSGKNDLVKGDREKIIIKSPVTLPVIKENTPVIEKELTNNLKQALAPAVTQNDKNSLVKKNSPVIKNKLPVIIPAPEKKEEQVVATNESNKPTNNLPKPLNNPNLNNINALNNVVVDNDNNAIKTLTTPPVTNPPIETSPPKNADVSFASLEEGSNNKKNRGFFRKLARTFEKRTNMTATDDDKLLVGGLAFKLK